MHLSGYVFPLFDLPRLNTSGLVEKTALFTTAEHNEEMFYKGGLSEMDIDMLHFRLTKRAFEGLSVCYLKTGNDDSPRSYLIHEEVAGLDSDIS